MDDQKELVKLERKVGDAIYWFLILFTIVWPIYTLW